MNRLKLAIASVALSLLCAGAALPAAQESSPRPVYPLYAIASNTPREPTAADLRVLARNFVLVQARFSPEAIRQLHKINPDFKVVHYYNSTYTSSADHVPIAEGRFRRALLMFRVATLGSNIDTTAKQFSLRRLQPNRPVSLRASTIAGRLSSGDPRRPSTKYYVTWIRIGDELMRIERFDRATGRITVTRGFDGSTATAHAAGDPVFSPVYLGSTNDAGAWPGGPGRYLRYAFDPANPAGTNWRLEQMIQDFQHGYDGFWLDICSASPFNLADSDGRHVVPWDFRTGRPYDKRAYLDGQQIKVHTIQTAIHQRFGHWPVVVANNMRATTFEPADGGQKLMLLATPIKPRPLDGYCIENYAGHFAARAAERARRRGPEYNPVSHWQANEVMLMKCAQQRLAAYPMIANAGVKSLLLEGLGPIRDQFEMFAYASYLLAVEKDSPTRLGLPVYYQENGRRFARLHPRYTWPIGAPAETIAPEKLDTYRVPGHLSYRRRFSNGIVLVNPEEKDDMAITLERDYYDPETGRKTNRVRLKAHTGKILLRQAAGRPAH